MDGLPVRVVAVTNVDPKIMSRRTRPIGPGSRTSNLGLIHDAAWPLVMKIAILDDYQNVALTMADWSRVESEAEITVFTDHVGEPDAVVARLQPFDVVCRQG
jgi:hypothetical protein